MTLLVLTNGKHLAASILNKYDAIYYNLRMLRARVPTQ